MHFFLSLPSAHCLVISFALPKCLFPGFLGKRKKPQCEVHPDANQSGFVGNTRLPRLQGKG
jgi:hypothetical protein